MLPDHHPFLFLAMRKNQLSTVIRSIDRCLLMKEKKMNYMEGNHVLIIDRNKLANQPLYLPQRTNNVKSILDLAIDQERRQSWITWASL